MAHPLHFFARAPRHLPRRAVALACLASAAAAHAQTEAPVLAPLVVKSQSPVSPTALTGFGDVPLVSIPMQATVIGRDQLEESQARRLADILTYEAAATDAYNSPGYWDYVALRGYVLDQRYNYRREGLPITAETVIPLANKERIEILKGTSGIQAGTSSPGGLVNYIVKRPTNAPLRSAAVSVGDRGSLGGGIDLGGRAGNDGVFGYRVNVAYENSKPEIDHYDHAERTVAAFAGDWRIAPQSLLEAEIEWSHQVGKSLPGHSLTGDSLPTVRKPDNLNNQPWSRPNVFDGLTGTVRFDQGFGGGWRWVSVVGAQSLKTDDRLAYPFGFECGTPTGYCDRYGPNGDYDVYDFRSEGERRRVQVAQTAVTGRVETGGISHQLHGGVQYNRRSVGVQTGSNNYVGVGNIDGTKVTPEDPTRAEPGTNGKERNLEFFATDAIDWGHGFSTWLGVRATRLHRQTIDTEGNDPTGYGDTVTTPWLAASYEWQPRQHVYASWGEGAESFVVPGGAGAAGYTNAGQVLQAKSRQWEVGTKGSAGNTDWGVAWFDIDRPAITDTGSDYFIDGSAHHRGIDGNVTQTLGAWQLRAGAMWLKARREGAADPALNGRTPVNVPEHTLKAQARYRVSHAPGLDLQANVTHEGRRNVLDDGSIELPSWTRTDLTARYTHKLDGTSLTWTLGVFNAFDKRAWKESPTNYGHVYLFPLESRTVRLTVLAEL